MTVLRLGLVVAEPSALAHIRPADALDLVVLRYTLLEMPRTAAARDLAVRLGTSLPGSEVVPYAWHLVTHEADDRLPQRGRRSAEGDARAFGHLADNPEVEAAWMATLRVVRALGAQHAIIRTPPSFAPGARGRGRLALFVERRRAEGVRLVWEPEGLWEPLELEHLAREFDLDLLAPLAPDQGLADLSHRWLTVGQTGSPAELRAADASSLAEDLADSEVARTTLVFGGPLGLKNLRRFRRAWAELGN